MSWKIVSLLGLGVVTSQQALAQALCTSSSSVSTKIRIERLETGCPTQIRLNNTDDLFCARLKLETADGRAVTTSSYRGECRGREIAPDKGFISCTGFNGMQATFSIMVAADKSYGSSLITRAGNTVSVATDRGYCADVKG